MTSDNQSLKTRALEALSQEPRDGAVLSALSQSGQFLLLTDEPDDYSKGTEFFVGFPKDDETPDSLDLSIAFYAKDRELFEGTWATDATLGGEALLPTGPWETLCEDFDKDYAFCERSIPLTDGRRLSRRLFFAYHESLVLVFDEFSGTSTDRENAPTWNYRTFFPLDRSLDALEDSEAREITFRRRLVPESNRVSGTAKKESKPGKILSEEERLMEELYSAEPIESEIFETLARIFPFSLPEWKADVSSGDFRVNDRPLGLELTAKRDGGVVTASLLIDVNARRAGRRCTWRPLTVGEKTQVVDEDSAVGRKIQLGREQYVLYASTSPRPAVRSVIGANLLSDFMFGKFTAKIGVDSIVNVVIEEEDLEEEEDEFESEEFEDVEYDDDEEEEEEFDDDEYEDEEDDVDDDDE
ncbi:MAG: hypothetical protein IJM54_05505 [Thermoguttaceae bacterium]|nr:hypothetical protein [Thermoguttaceae bacterium]